MTEAINIGLGGILIVAFGFVVFKAMTVNSRQLADIYTTNKDEAIYGIHKGYVDDGLTNDIRKKVYEKYGERCYITGRIGYQGDADTNGEHILVGIGIKKELQIGHVVPRKLGGPTQLWNLRPMEKKLNGSLKDKITPMAEGLCRQRGEKIWTRGITKTTFEAEKKKLAKKKAWRMSS